MAGDEIRKRATEVQALVHKVQEWRTEQDPGTPEWLTLCELADQAEGLIAALPWRMQPAPTAEELIELMGL
ncbi:hypothetical protein [Streptomyces sp. NPDC048057]|uniref:hypothetical protein n=1 Tax=Streptomyces sp. NPDC048057 TaxID=3155628 RepID=UPI0033E2D06C